MKTTGVIRKVGRWGKSVGVRLSAEAQRALEVKTGDGLYEVITNDGAVELQPLAPPTEAARRRRYLSNRVRALERQHARLRAKADASYQAGFNDGFDKGVMYGLKGLFLTLERALPKLERFLDATAMEPTGNGPQHFHRSSVASRPALGGGGAHLRLAPPSGNEARALRRGRVRRDSHAK